MSDPSRRIRRAAAVALSLTLAACGNFTPGGFSRVSVGVSGDAEDPAPVSGTSAMTAAGAPAAADGDGAPEGELRAEFDLFLVSQDDRVTQLNQDIVRVRVDLRGREEIEAVERLVEAGTYTELRIVFRAIRAEVDSGLVIDGVPVIGEVRVELEDLGLEVSRPLGLTLAEGDRADLLVDLNAAAWLQAVDPSTRLVDPSVFGTLIDVVVR